MKTTKAQLTATVAAAIAAGAAPVVTEVPATGKAKTPKARVAKESVIASTVGAAEPAAFVGPVQPKAPAKASAPHGDTYCLTEMAEAVVGKNTLQRSAAGFGKEWRKAGKVDTSIRYQALAALAEAADEEGCISRADALTALASIKDALGCSSPAVRLAKFVRSGHLSLS